MKKYNILVTGCGGDIGQSIGKILKNSNLFNNVFGADITNEHAGVFIYDQLIILPKCNAPDYIYKLTNILQELEIDLLLPISEPELRMLTDLNIDSVFLNTKLVCANLKSRQVGFDKYRTVNFLKESNLPYPETFLIGNGYPIKLPMILKSRMGSGSKSIFILNDVDEFEFYQKKYPDFIAQELIKDTEDEFTCGLFRSKNGDVRSIIYKRKLVDSYSGYGEVVENHKITNLLNAIAINLDLIGSINVQLKISEKGPCVFEINPRFSSTVKFRDMMGFTDLIWSIEDLIYLSINNYTPPRVGTKFYKGFYEYTL